jgi:hypothetical protein
MDEILSLKEIKSKFDSEWVIIAEPRTKENLQIVSGKVIAHSKSRDEIYEIAKKLSSKYSAILYTGKMKKDAAIVL